MAGSATKDEQLLELPTDEELCALALVADPETEVADDAVSLWELTGAPEEGPLPSWYMPAAAGGRLLSGWRRVPPLLIVGSLLVINGCGLCITYGKLGFT
ncbi:MAG: hypothetical protein ACXVKN_08995 [Acidimicrobiia bacterium]